MAKLRDLKNPHLSDLGVSKYSIKETSVQICIPDKGLPVLTALSGNKRISMELNFETCTHLARLLIKSAVTQTEDIQIKHSLLDVAVKIASIKPVTRNS